VTAITDDTGDLASREAVATSGAALRALVWARFEGRLGEGVKRVVICPDAALASVPFAALPGKGPNTVLGDEVALSHVFHPFDLVPRARMGPGVGALVVGGVDYGRAAGGTEEAPAPARPPVLASRDRAPRGGTFGPIPATKVEAEALRDRFGRDATTLLLGADATEARLREGVKGKRFVHVATHGFARTDLLAGLYDRKIEEAFLSAGAERQLSVGHDPMLLSARAGEGQPATGRAETTGS
jgi:CHAT domain-containing protein